MYQLQLCLWQRSVDSIGNKESHPTGPSIGGQVGFFPTNENEFQPHEVKKYIDNWSKDEGTEVIR